MHNFDLEDHSLPNNIELLYDDAVELVRRHGRAKADILANRLKIRHEIANKLLTRMEEEGIIGPQNINPDIPREILDYGN